eukprot:TRINITY_DN3721_c0_g1_i1.p1 TRINITY_DN3721_c0_g1~~TRINITY_DN3721_c0_g1_i1.p1  ORF type:complete len:195 (+),score=35.84 TRINITY_DN3721_c0_g1_i1:33-617(+)
MGCSSTKIKDNAKIKKRIESGNSNYKNKAKLLLLGAGESGKSTLMKQIQLLSIGFSDTDKVKWVAIIRENIINGMNQLISACETLGIDIQLENKEVIQRIQSQRYKDMILNEYNYEEDILAVWFDAGIQECFERRAEFQFIESVGTYYLRKDGKYIEYIFSEEYLPTNNDLVHARLKTTGVVEFNIVSLLLVQH